MALPAILRDAFPRCPGHVDIRVAKGVQDESKTRGVACEVTRMSMKQNPFDMHIS